MKRDQNQSTSGKTTAVDRRDHRIDWLRGVALVSIFVNHMPGNRFENWTSRNFGFSDAAEMFVLLAGIAAAFAFFPRAARGEHHAVARRAVRRAGVLYASHLASTVAAVALFAVAAWLLDNDGVFELIGIGPILAAPSTGLLAIVTGSHQLGYFNILPLYVFLILSVPILMVLAAYDVRSMLAASFAVYLAAHLLPIEMPNYPTDGGWFFNPFAWQFIFTVGIALGVLKLRGKSVPWHPVAGALALGYVAFSCVWMVYDMGGRVSFGLLPIWIDTLHKSMLPATRLLHVLALAYLLVHSPLWALMARISPNNFLTRMGRNSLPVFVVGSLLSMVGYIILVHTGRLLWLEVALTVGGVALMTALAAAVEAGMFQSAKQRAKAAIMRPVRAAPDLTIEHDDTPVTRR